ncbi:hypothetical protein SAMN05192574_11517 [Mucilaginibacter gossypiicola]|uniref:Uncharacterized protein n=1 Tax=Mucilaginibacter gossypiicola TaxID=551995 RepID=A0A1H8TBB1_9SPHI|nr:hypothetical protein [Mucilaginibacter gossypiicola]SEO87874.1 hypothetical protein SAMN05192574_11517 [Mucilaginibacter gossypiicola]
MKQFTNPAKVLGLLAIVLVTVFWGCHKETVTNSELNISGRWIVPAAFSNQGTQYEYNFKTDHTFEGTVTSVDSVSKKLIGTISKRVGKYKIQNSVLTFYDITDYQNKNNDFGPLSELVAINNIIAITANYNMILNADGNVLTLTYICGPAEDCSAPQGVNYFKQ